VVVGEVPTPTSREQQILKVLWDQGPSTVKAVHRELTRDEPEGQETAYTTVQTLLRLMEDKGLVSHRTEGRTFVYSACYSRDQSAARFLDRVFDGAAGELLLSLVRSERLTAEELERAQDLIERARKRGKP
jgi:predicted transcriptional regulator